jgi:hypothetical protein
MIKKYNQFVKGVNEEFQMGDQPSPTITPTPTTTPIPTRPRPIRPGITPTEIPSEEDAPLAYSEEGDEEVGGYIGEKMMDELASTLGVEMESDGSINYNDKKIDFYSETEMFHIDNKRFKTVDEVVDYLKTITPEEEEEMTGERESFESKSYKRSFESYKRKK